MKLIYEDDDIKKVFLQPYPTESNKKIKKLIDKCLEYIYSYSNSQHSWSEIEENHKNEIISIKNQVHVSSKVVIDYCLIFVSQISPSLRKDFLYFVEEFCPSVFIDHKNSYGESKKEIFNQLRKEV
jgi:hypothetical protein